MCWNNLCICSVLGVHCYLCSLLCIASVWRWPCMSVCIAVDIDATGLDPEDNELPVHLRSSKVSQPNTVMSPTLAKDKRMPFFKKVNMALRWYSFSTCISSLRPSARLPMTTAWLWLLSITLSKIRLSVRSVYPTCLTAAVRVSSPRWAFEPLACMLPVS